MHPDLSVTLAKMRIDDLHREAALYRFAHEVSRHRRRRAWNSAAQATKESMNRAGGEQPCAES